MADEVNQLNNSKEETVHVEASDQCFLKRNGLVASQQEDNPLVHANSALKRAFNSRITLRLQRVALGSKNVPRRMLTKTSNLFLFDCEPERIGHDDFKESNFEDDRQPEIACGRLNQKYDRYHQNSNGKPRTFDHGGLEDTCYL